MTNNPLASLYRTKSLYISLPSGGRFYKSGINLTVDNELGIMPMTVKDEMILNTPDALFNGEGLIEVIKNCVPDIKNPKEIPICDLDVIIIAIKAASEENITLSTTCPSCKKDTEYEQSLLSYLATVKPIPVDNKIKINDNTIVTIMPYTSESIFKSKIQKLKIQKVEKELKATFLSNKDIDDTDESILVNLRNTLLTLYSEITDITMDIIVSSIESVTICDSNVEVTEKQFIKEWISNIDSKTYEILVDSFSKFNKDGIEKTITCICSHCSNSFNTEVELNPVNFSIRKFPHSTT
jgi:hypothetical protein